MEYIETSVGLFPKLGLGTFSIPHNNLKLLIPEAVNLGYTLFDTAAKYGNEEVIGEVLKNYERSSLLIESKANFMDLIGNIRYLRLNKKTIKSCYRRSLYKIDLKYLDIYMLHCVFSGYEKSFEELMKLKNDGVVKYVGICNINLEQLKTLYNKIHLYPDIVQIEIHPYYSNKELIKYCQNNGIIIEARSPLAHGDAMGDWKSIGFLEDLANKHNASIPQIILRWITQQNVVAIPRTNSIMHLRENMDSFKIVLNKEEMNMIDSLNINKSYGVISTIK